MLITDGVHLVSTESEEELHNFAGRLGLCRNWYQGDNDHPHYDLTSRSKIEKAVSMGARFVRPRDIIKSAWWASSVPSPTLSA